MSRSGVRICSPALKMRPPKLDERPVPVLTDDELRALLHA
jgi:hypothetical protein